MSSEQWDRQYRFTAGKAGGVGFEIGEADPVGLHIYFNVQKVDVSTANTSKITLWNLNPSHLAALNEKDCVVTLKAGYGTPVQLALSEQTKEVTFDNSENENAVQFAEIEISYNLPDDVEPEYKAEPIPVRHTVTVDEQSDPEADNNIEVAALALVQQIVEATDSTRKLTLKVTKNFALILYRNCSICGLMYNKDGKITKISFMDTTPEARKKYKATRYDFNGLDDLESHRDEILAQVEFVNEWLNAERSA